MNDATGGTHADNDALEPLRKTNVYPGEADVDADANENELGDVETAINEQAK